LNKITSEYIINFLKINRPNSILLSKYKDRKTYLKIKCENDHIFYITWNKLQQKRWCKECWKNKCYHTNKDFQDLLDKLHPNSKLLSNYKNNRTYVLISCENNHKFKTTYTRVKRGEWCQICSNKINITIEHIRSFVKEKFNGECLSSSYNGCDNHLLFKCSCGNEFKQTWWAIKDGNKNRWCHLCRDAIIPTINFIKDYVKNNFDGYCLESEYKNVNSKMKFKCNKNHIFVSKWNYVKNSNNWCPECFGTKKPTLKEIKEFVKLKNDGKLISKSYENAISKLIFKCKENHIFKATWSNVKHGDRWCPICRGGVKKDLKEIKLYVKEKYNGECLTINYKNQETKMIFKCKEEHEFERTWREIKRDIWCSRCNPSKGESFCRKFFEEKFGKEFPKIRPEWLTNENGNRLELDGYCEELNIAFEYNGRQHYEIVKDFKMTEEDLLFTQEMDKIKKEKCLERDIILYIIPQFKKKFSKKQIEYIIKNHNL